MMIDVDSIDLDNLTEESVYKAFQVDGHEAEALNDSYLDLYELIGRDATLKLYKDKINELRRGESQQKLTDSKE